MTTFAERLVARATGQAGVPGLAMLRPRQASRFEPGPVVELTQETVLRAPAVGPAASPATGRETAAGDTAPAARNSEEPRAAPRPRQRWEAADEPLPPRDHARPADAPLTEAGEGDMPVADTWRAAAATPRRPRAVAHGSAADTADRPPPPASPRGQESHGHAPAEGRRVDREVAAPNRSRRDPAPARFAAANETEAAQPLSGQRPPNQRQGRPGEDPPRPTGQRHHAAAIQDSPDSAEIMPPQVTIGRIDVQFLPSEIPKPAASPRTERTRGFETYARARRGQPR